MPSARSAMRSTVASGRSSPTSSPLWLTTTSVLFLCIQNAGRSKMAAGWLRQLGGDRVTVYSGGSEPASQINPAAIDAVAEVGIDITAEFPKPWTDEVVRAADVVITMGCGDACPLYPGKRYEDGSLPTRPALTSLRCDRSETTSASVSRRFWRRSVSRRSESHDSGASMVRLQPKRLAERVVCYGASLTEHEPRRWLNRYRPVDGDDPAQVMDADHGVFRAHCGAALVTDTHGYVVLCCEGTVEAVHRPARSSVTSAALGSSSDIRRPLIVNRR